MKVFGGRKSLVAAACCTNVLVAIGFLPAKVMPEQPVSDPPTDNLESGAHRRELGRLTTILALGQRASPSSAEGTQVLLCLFVGLRACGWAWEYRKRGLGE